jgi:hypothetical protein
VGAFVAPLFKSPHDIIEPSALRAAKALSPNARAFAVLKSDGSIVAWGDSRYGGGYLSRVAPSDSGYIKIYSNARAFAARAAKALSLE